MQITRQNHFSRIHHGDLAEKSIAGSLPQDVAWSKLVCHPVGEELDAFVQDIVHNVTKGLVWKHVALVPVEYDTHTPEDVDRQSDAFDSLELLPSMPSRRKGLPGAPSSPIISSYTDLWTSCGPPASSAVGSGTSGQAGVMPEDGVIEMVPGRSPTLNAVATSLPSYKSRKVLTPGQGANPNPNPKLGSMLQLMLNGSRSVRGSPICGNQGFLEVGTELGSYRGHRSMENYSGPNVTSASKMASSSTGFSTSMTPDGSNCQFTFGSNSPLAAISSPEAPIIWIEVTIKTVTDHEEGMCSLMIIQEDVSEREKAVNQLCNLTEAQLTIMAETYPRHIIDYMSVSSPNEAPDVQATDVLTFLNELFTPFDHMCDLHDVQKVETAGDCYIVAAGIIEKQPETGFCNILEAHDPVHSATKVLAFAKSMISHAKTMASGTSRASMGGNSEELGQHAPQ
eukprot:gene19406-26063_t